jgi:hypothetical protein
VVDGIVAHFSLNFGRSSEVREFGEDLDLRAATDGLDAGIQ